MDRFDDRDVVVPLREFSREPELRVVEPDELRVVVPRLVVVPRVDDRVVVPSLPVFEVVVVVPREVVLVGVDRVVVPRDVEPVVDERVVVPFDDRVLVRDVARLVSDEPLVTARPLLERVVVFPSVVPLEPRTTVRV